MHKPICASTGLVIFFLSLKLLAATDQSPVISAIMHDVTELGDIIQKKHAVFDPAISTNITSAIIKAIDPYSEILAKEQVERRAEEARGIYYGIGISLTVKNKVPTITEVAKDSPAATAGIKPGNTIEKIDDQKTEGMPLENVTAKLRGARDEPVKISLRSGEKNAETNEYTLKRSLIQMPMTGVTEDWPYQICFMKINGLYENSGLQISTQMLSWAEGKSRSERDKCPGIILDLRNANGHDLQSVADVAGLFAPADTPIFNVRDGSGSVITAYKSKSSKTIDALVMVLINHNTCGAAETLAAALGTCKNVLIIGEPTRGDAYLREFLPLSDGRIVYLATRKIEMARGLPYHGAGVNPQVSVTQTNEAVKADESAANDENGLLPNLSEQEKNNRALMRRTRGDAALQRAVDILLGLKALNIKGR